MECPNHPLRCVNCPDHFNQLRPLIKEAVATKHFKRDLPGFNVNLILDCQHEHFTHLHKFEFTTNGNHIFRALYKGKHIVYAVDQKNRLILLRAFKNTKEYEKYLENKKKIQETIEG
ncbi:MAG: hypothetical protein ABH851_03240 [Methanobacteriota archaeon]